MLNISITNWIFAVLIFLRTMCICRFSLLLQLLNRMLLNNTGLLILSSYLTFYYCGLRIQWLICLLVMNEVLLLINVYVIIWVFRILLSFLINFPLTFHLNILLLVLILNLNIFLNNVLLLVFFLMWSRCVFLSLIDL